MIRSFLFCPADDPKKMSKAIASETDAVIFDLEDSVAPDRKFVAREVLGEFIAVCDKAKPIWVRVNAFDTGLIEDDLACASYSGVSGVVLPKCRTADDITAASDKLATVEEAAGLKPGSIKIVPVATETPRALFEIDKIATASPRVWGMTWGAEDLAAAIGAFGNTAVDGRLRPVFEYARTACLLASRAANIEPIDTASMNISNHDVLRDECRLARFDGFSGKLAIHPKQIDFIHDAFAPSNEEIAFANEIVAAFRDNPNAGALRLNGKMIDAPHLKTAEKILQLATLSRR